MSSTDLQPTAGEGPLGVAVIGAGYWGPNLVRNFQGSASFRLRWLCDLDVNRARKVLGGYSTVETTDDYAKVLADDCVTAVAIATPAATHKDLALAALEAGKHVLIEKPLAATYADGRILVDEAERRGLTLMCDHTYCYTPAIGRVRQAIRGGELGDLRFIDSVRINLGLVQPDVDVLWDLAPHDLSILDFVLPDDVAPVAVAAHATDPLDTGRSCLAYLSIWLSNGALAHLHVNWLSPIKVRTTIFGGSRRTIVWDDMSPAARLMIHDRGVDRLPAQPDDLDERRRKLVSYRIGDMCVPALPEREALLSVMAEFADAIARRRPAMTDGRSGLRVLRVLEAASLSAETGGRKIEVEAGDEPARG